MYSRGRKVTARQLEVLVGGLLEPSVLPPRRAEMELLVLDGDAAPLR